MKGIRLSNFGKLIELMEINGVKAFFHWSVLLIGAVTARWKNQQVRDRGQACSLADEIGYSVPDLSVQLGS
jgi:hypothetical protein